MKSILVHPMQLPRLGLFITGLFLTLSSCFLEETAEPYTGAGGYIDLSTGGFVSIDPDSALWSWGKVGNNLPGDSARASNNPFVKVESK